jgi:hypothetical protein
LTVWRLSPVAGALIGDVARYLLAGVGLLLLFALSLSWAWTTTGLARSSTS